jgi:hypothetical protein
VSCDTELASWLLFHEHLPAYEEMRGAMTVSTQEVIAQMSEPGVPLQFPHIEK